MTDGPFRNAKLGSRWKRYGEELVSDAASTEERTAQACHSMIGDVDMKAFTLLYTELSEQAERPQMELNPADTVEMIFKDHPISSLSDTLQRHYLADLRDQISSEKALNQALGSAVRDSIGIAMDRLDGECLSALHRGDMNQKDCHKGIERNHEAFANIKPSDLCHALATGYKRAFKQAGQKKSSVDEGPEE